MEYLLAHRRADRCQPLSPATHLVVQVCLSLEIIPDPTRRVVADNLDALEVFTADIARGIDQMGQRLPSYRNKFNPHKNTIHCYMTSWNQVLLRVATMIVLFRFP